MNKKIFDVSEIKAEFPNALKIGEIFTALEQQTQAKGEIVCRFSVNGMQVSENEESKFSDFDISELQEICIETENPERLLDEVIQNWLQGLPKMIQETDALSQEIRFKGIETRLKDFVDLVDSCQFLIESLISLRTLCSSSSVVQSKSWAENEKLTSLAIQEALNVFEKKDLVLLADVIEYDLGHCLQSWFETLNELRKDVRETPCLMGPL